MNDKRKTALCVLLIVGGILAGLFIGYCIAGASEQTFLSVPQWGISGPSDVTAGSTQPEPTQEPTQESVPDTTAAELVPTAPEETIQPPKVCFTQADVEAVTVKYSSYFSQRADLASLLLQELDWDLSGDEPTVLIVHTHATEGYTDTASSSYHTEDTDRNMVAVGDLLTQLLEDAGITVIHDRALHDAENYNSAYTNSRSAVEAYLEQYPSIQLVLDLHRDAYEYNGVQQGPTVTVEDREAAQLMLVVGGSNAAWQENLATSLKLQAVLERLAPGITRPTFVQALKYNQDLSTGFLLVEVGAAGNTLEEAEAAMDILAQALIQMMYGSTAE